MGSSTSRMDSSPSSSRKSSGSRGSSLKRTKQRISSFLICGSSAASNSPLQIEECPHGSPVSSAENLAPGSHSSWNSMAESSSLFGSDAGCMSSKLETGASSNSSNSTAQENFVSTVNREASGHQKCLSNGKELVSCQPSQSAISATTTTAGTHISRSEDVSFICSDEDHTGGLTQGQRNSHTDGNSVENDVASLDSEVSDSRSLSISADPSASVQLSDDGNSEVPMPLSTGFRMSDSERDLERGDVLHVDVVSISSNTLSSNIGEISSREARRNNRRLYWEALSRHSFSRNSDFPTIVFATGHADDLGSHDRWLLDLGGDLPSDGIGHLSSYLGSRSRLRSGRSWLLRSEISERVLRGHGEGSQHTGFCASGLHPNGTCSCESFLSAEESGTLASISRIIMLAEALFEVLDEIHRQPLSASLSMLTLPAPESVVDSFPIKYFKKLEAVESRPSEVPQCYICLTEYDEGEKLRVLPCHHEYHMSCVDKWLKEINRVCPLCRCNVCDSSGQDSNTEIPLQQ